MDARLALLKKMAKASPAISACPEAQKHEANKLAAIANGDLAATCALLHKQLLAMAAKSKELRAAKKSLEQKVAHVQESFALIDANNRRLWNQQQEYIAALEHSESKEKGLKRQLAEERELVHKICDQLEAEKARAAAALEAEKARNQESADSFLRKIASQSAQLRESYEQYDYLCDLHDAAERKIDELSGMFWRAPEPAQPLAVAEPMLRASTPGPSDSIAKPSEAVLEQLRKLAAAAPGLGAQAPAAESADLCRLATEEEMASLKPAGNLEGLEAVLKALRCETPPPGDLGVWCPCCPSLSPIRAPKELSVPGAPRKAPLAAPETDEENLYD